MNSTSPSQKVLDVGCGWNKTAGATGIDFYPKNHADLVVRLAGEPLAGNWVGAYRESRSAVAEFSLHPKVLGVLSQPSCSRQGITIHAGSVEVGSQGLLLRKSPSLSP